MQMKKGWMLVVCRFSLAVSKSIDVLDVYLLISVCLLFNQN